MRNRLILLALATAATVTGVSYYDQPGSAMLVKHEALVTQAYPDPAYGWAVPTICVGHTRTARRGMVLTKEECLDLLWSDLDQALVDLRSLVGPSARLTPGELLGTTSFVFNIGPTKLRSSTWRKKFLAGDRVGACNEMRRWVYANGKKLRGLETRRIDEEAVCLRDLQASP
jgi:lysozyme